MGYMNNKDGMGEYAALFHSLGYNVVLQMHVDMVKVREIMLGMAGWKKMT